MSRYYVEQAGDNGVYVVDMTTEKHLTAHEVEIVFNEKEEREKKQAECKHLDQFGQEIRPVHNFCYKCGADLTKG